MRHSVLSQNIKLQFFSVLVLSLLVAGPLLAAGSGNIWKSKTSDQQWTQASLFGGAGAGSMLSGGLMAVISAVANTIASGGSISSVGNLASAALSAGGSSLASDLGNAASGAVSSNISLPGIEQVAPGSTFVSPPNIIPDNISGGTIVNYGVNTVQTAANSATSALPNDVQSAMNIF